MIKANLKIDLIKKISQVRDSNVIDEINRVLDFELDEGIFNLNSNQKARILEGKKEYKTGKILSEKEANNQIQEWLSK